MWWRQLTRVSFRTCANGPEKLLSVFMLARTVQIEHMTSERSGALTLLNRVLMGRRYVVRVEIRAPGAVQLCHFTTL
jgi:hypothetical protein